MPKWSKFILDLGTSGPPTLQGIYNLGFALRSEIPALFAKYVRVDAPQSFTDPEKAQARSNIGIGTIATQNANDVDITGGDIVGVALSGLTTPLAVANGGTGGATQAAARTGIGLGSVNNTSDADKPVSTAQQTALNLKANLNSPAFTGNPTAPTPPVGDNDTSIATTAYVRAEFPNLLNATGAAPVFAARAWANFNGEGTIAIRASGNVSSVTDIGVGTYGVNFITSMPDANYSVFGFGGKDVRNLFLGTNGPGNLTASSCTIRSVNDAGTSEDGNLICIQIVR